MTKPSDTLVSFGGGEPGQLRLEQPPDLGFGDAARPQLVHRGGDDGLAGAQPVGELLLARRAR